MMSKSFSAWFLALSATALPLTGSAGLIVESLGFAATPENLGGWELTDIGETGPNGLTNSITSGAFSGEILFEDYYGDALDMMRVRSGDVSHWWNNYETQDYDVFATHEAWVEMVLPENTRAISFNVGSSFYGWGWLLGISDNDFTDIVSFDLSPESTPGFGLYADNSNGGCDSISSVVIDPILWGVGNISIAQSDQCVADVPEPGVFTLLGLGILGLGYARYKGKESS